MNAFVSTDPYPAELDWQLGNRCWAFLCGTLKVLAAAVAVGPFLALCLLGGNG